MEITKEGARNSAARVTFIVDDPAQAAADLAHILLNLRYHARTWDDRLESKSKIKKKYWEDKADKWLEQHTKVNNSLNKTNIT